MLRITYDIEPECLQKKVNAASFGVGKEKRVMLIKRVNYHDSLRKRLRDVLY